MQSPTLPTASSAQANPNAGKAVVSRSAGLSLIVFALLACGGCALDLVTKSWIFGRLGSVQVQNSSPTPPIWLIDRIFGFETSLNEGALFGMGQGQVTVFALLSVLAAVGILLWLILARGWRDLHLTISLGFVMAGILGNLYDRLGFHCLTWASGIGNHAAGQPVYAVRDWLHFKIDAIGFDWPIFNLADSFLVCGAILLVWHAIRHRG
jgi:signal peptidase II